MAAYRVREGMKIGDKKFNSKDAVSIYAHINNPRYRHHKKRGHDRVTEADIQPGIPIWRQRYLWDRTQSNGGSHTEKRDILPKCFAVCISLKKIQTGETLGK